MILDKFTWQRFGNGMFIERAMMDYVIAEKMFWVGWWVCMYSPCETKRSATGSVMSELKFNELALSDTKV